MPHISAVEAVKITLVVFAILGTVRLVTLSYPDNPVSQAFLLLY